MDQMRDNLLVSLNEEQKVAVDYNKGPLLIIAGAGTGKTRVVVEKIKSIIKNNLARPEEILALTFTEKAAREMEERVDQAIPYGYFQMWISTFHAFADKILKEEAPHIGLSTGYRLMTEAEAIIFLRQNLFLFDLKYFRPLSNPNKFLEALLQHFSRLKDEDISPEDYLQWAKTIQTNKELESEEKAKYLELAQAYQKYQALKIKESLVDFSDLVFYTLQLFRQRPNILRKYTRLFKFVLVDEFQDTNIAQYALIKTLCPPNKNPCLTVVGDDSQAIYKFRGASISNILNFMSDYPQAKQVTLRKNYRSNQTILDAAYRLIKNNDPDTLEAKLGISKNLISQKEDDKKAVNFYLAEKVEEEADYVVKQILNLKKQYKYSDFAILVRANNHSFPFIRALIRNGVPYQFLGPGMLYKQPEVKDLIAYLKVLGDPGDSTSLYRVLTMDIFGFDIEDIAMLLSYAKRTSLTLFQAIEVYLSFFDQNLYQKEFEKYKRYLPLIKEEARTKLMNIYKMIKRHLSLVKKETAGQILYYFFEDTNYLSRLINYKTEKEEKIALNISKFFGKLKSFEAEHEDASVFAFVDYIDMCLELGESPSDVDTDISAYDAVNILTVHSAKGLEFPVIFLVNLTQGRFPTYEKKEIIPIPQELIREILPEGDYHLEEERRLFYVGMTRAMDKVFLSASLFYGEGKRERKISTFLLETLGKDLVVTKQMSKRDEKIQLSIFDFKKPEEKIIKNNYVLSNFSFTQLETFKMCPLQYKYQYILKVPTTPSAAASFGDSIHRSLQKFYSEFMTDKKIGKDRIIAIFKETWIPIGYTSPAHEARMKKEGELMLTAFYEQFHSPNIQIVALEKLFKIKIDGNIFVTGKIDRIDSNGNGEIEIIDYKTGKTPPEKELKKSLQLSIYALAAIDKGLYRKNLDQVNLSFYYLQERKKISMKRTETELKNVKEEIKTLVLEIRNNGFLPKVGPWCQYCSFRIICEAWQ